MIEIGKVIASTPGTIQVILKDVEVFENNKPNIRISRYVVIEDGNDLKILAAIQNISAVQSNDAKPISYTLSCSPIGSLVDVLPTLSAGECLAVGDAVPLPAVIKMDMPYPVPNSSNVNVYDEWNKDWIDIAFEEVIKRWRKE